MTGMAPGGCFCVPCLDVVWHEAHSALMDAQPGGRPLAWPCAGALFCWLRLLHMAWPLPACADRCIFVAGMGCNSGTPAFASYIDG